MLRIIILVLLLALVLPLSSCDRGGATKAVHIGIVTGTVSQGEDEVRAAEAIAKLYPGRVHHVTYPDKFMQEQETVVSQIVGLAANPDIKVIILGQAVPGSLIAVRKVRETRKDILFGFVEPHEDPKQVNSVADIAIQPDQMARGRHFAKLAKTMGARTVVHYSFPRHMSMAMLARRRDEMSKACREEGIEFVLDQAPDPMAEGGLPATQQYVLEDVPRKVAKYGEATAFFTTNCGMQDPLIKATIDAHAMFLEPCCPSPTHGFPTALGISIPEDKAGDFDYINEQNRKRIAEHGMSGRMGTWPVSGVIVSLHATTKLLVDAAEGRLDHRKKENVQKAFEAFLGEDQGVTLERYDDESGNYWLMLLDTLIY